MVQNLQSPGLSMGVDSPACNSQMPQCYIPQVFNTLACHGNGKMDLMFPISWRFSTSLGV